MIISIPFELTFKVQSIQIKFNDFFYDKSVPQGVWLTEFVLPAFVIWLKNYFFFFFEIFVMLNVKKFRQ